MAIDSGCESLARKALEIESLAPLIEHDPAECEQCAEYERELLAFAKEALPRLAHGYLTLATSAFEAFENAKLRGRFLADLEEENARLKKELAARTEELEELAREEPAKKGWLR